MTEIIHELMHDLLSNHIYLTLALAILLAVIVLEVLYRWQLHSQLRKLTDYVNKMAKVTPPLKMNNLHIISNLNQCFHSLLGELERRTAALQESHDILTCIIDTSLDGYWCVDDMGTLVNVNPTYCAQSGYSREELLGMSVTELDYYDDIEAMSSRINTLHREGRLQFETKHITKNKTIWDVEVSASFHDSLNGRIFTFLRDITARKQNAISLEKSLIAAQIADKAKDEFLANITHELRTPLSAMIGFADLARSLSNNPKQQDYLDKIETSGKILTTIINDLLDLSKIVAGRLIFESKPFRLSSIIERSLSVISYNAHAKGLELISYIDKEIPDILIGDSLRIEQILLNLLSNAVKFTIKGKVVLTIGIQARDINKICISIKVEDTGIGMSDEEMSILFKPFSQVDATMSRRFGGTGLGLAICKHLISDMAGDISVTSRKNEGSVFTATLWLPIAAETDIVEDTIQHKMLDKYENKNILVVDDQPFNREIVEGLLSLIGISTQLASNGQEAVDILLNSPDNFDIILMDLRMPVMDGITTTIELRKNPKFNKIPIIAMTAHTMQHEKEKCILAGMNDHIGKPFNQEMFYTTIGHWLNSDLPAVIIDRSFPIIHGIDVTAGLALLNNSHEKYTAWLFDFIKSTPNELSLIQEHINIKHYEQASFKVHAIKGRAGLLGMVEFHKLLTSFELLLDQGQTDNMVFCSIEQMMQELKNDVEQVLLLLPD